MHAAARGARRVRSPALPPLRSATEWKCARFGGHTNNYYPATYTQEEDDRCRCIFEAQLRPAGKTRVPFLSSPLAWLGLSSRQAKSTPQKNNSREHATLQLQRLFDLAGYRDKNRLGHCSVYFICISQAF
jgi:hypothetical protein